MAKLTLSDLASFTNSSLTTINSNWALIEAAFENTLSRDGTSPNTMSASLDMNSNRIVNLAAPSNSNDAARLQDISDSDATGAASATLRADLGNTSSTVLGDALLGVKSSLAGTIARTQHDKNADWVSVKEFGAVGNGSTDDTAAIQTAINTIQALKGILYFPEGTYQVSSALTVTGELELRGSRRGSVLRTTSATANILTLSGVPSNPGCFVHMLEFSSTVARTAGAYIESASSQGTRISKVRMNQPYNGIVVSGASVQNLLIEDIDIEQAVNRGILINASTNTGGPALVGIVVSSIQRALIVGSAGTHTPVGIEVTCCGDLTLSDIGTIYCDTGLRLSPRSAAVSGLAFKETIQVLLLSDCFFDTGTAYGMHIGASGEVRLVQANHVWCASFGQFGTLLDATGTVLDTLFDNCMMVGNTNGGLNINTTTVTNTKVRGGTYAGNTGGSGIGVGAGVTDFSIIGAVIGQTDSANIAFAGNGGYGIIVNAGASNNYIIANNTIKGNTLGQILDGGTGTTKVVANNIPTMAHTTYAPTVTLVGGAGNVVPQYTTNTGRWTKSDRLVYVQVYLDGDGGNEGAGTGVINIALPFAGKAVYKTNAGRALNNASLYQLNANIGEGASVASLEYWTSVAGAATLTGADQNNATRRIELSFSYEATS